MNVQEAMVSIGRFKSVANLFHQMGFRTDHLNLKAKRVLYGIALGSVGDLCPHRSHASIQGLHQVEHLILTTIK